MEHLIYKDSTGAAEADEHYLKTGHKIIVEGQILSHIWGKDNRLDKLKKYKCSKCDFHSFAGEQVVVT